MQVETAGLVVNAGDARRGRIATSTVTASRELDVEVLAVVGDRREMREAWRLRVPVVERAAGFESATWYRGIAAQLVERATEVPA